MRAVLSNPVKSVSPSSLQRGVRPRPQRHRSGGCRLSTSSLPSGAAHRRQPLPLRCSGSGPVAIQPNRLRSGRDRPVHQKLWYGTFDPCLCHDEPVRGSLAQQRERTGRRSSRCPLLLRGRVRCHVGPDLIDRFRQALPAPLKPFHEFAVAHSVGTKGSRRDSARRAVRFDFRDKLFHAATLGMYPHFVKGKLPCFLPVWPRSSFAHEK